MPIFDYQCRQCKNEFEALVIGKTVPECPACQSKDLEQLLSGFAVSSEGLRLASAAKSRRAQMTSSNHIEQVVAQREYEKNHEH
jgi:putative FmdB family regulatory protein